MEVKEKSKKRELIKSIAIVFLVVMLLLTFFSNTFMNRSLPEVSTQMILPGTINAKIRGSGTVSPNESYEVVLNQTREVRSICVRVGDTVEQGDLLFVLEDVESQELKDAQEQLQTLNINYQKQILNLSKDYATEDRSIQKIQEDMQKAISDRDLNLVTETDVSFAKGDLASAKNEQSQIGLILEELKDLLNDNEDYQAAKAAVEEWTGIVKDYESQLDRLEDGDVDTKSLQRQIADAKQELADATAALQRDELLYLNDYNNLVTATIRYFKENKDIDINENTANFDSYLEAYIDISGDETSETAYKALRKSQDAVAEKETALERLERDLDDLLDANDTSELRYDLQRKLKEAKRELSDAEDDLADAEDDNEALKTQIKSYEAAQREQEAYVETLSDQLKELEAKKGVYDAALETIAAKERELADALNGKDIDKKLDNLDLQAAQLEIQKQQELVNKYREESVDTEIKANVSGTVSAINVSAGKDTTAGSPMAVIDVVDRGYTIKIPVTNQQAKQVKVGDTADVSNYYWGNDIVATLEAIAPDPAKPGQGKLLIFRVTGEIDAGTTISLSIGQKSASFDTVVPKSALRSDTNGDFVLVLTSKSTPLGNRYIATRVDVQILAEDDTSAAVSGLSANDFVITTSSKPVEAGTQVRMVDEA